MKTSLQHCIAAAVLALVPATASATCEFIDDFAVQHISPDGRYIVSCIQGALHIRDLETDDEWFYEPDFSDVHMYNSGLGNCFALDGTMVGSTRNILDACWWKDGEWHELPVGGSPYNNMANGITPDGRVICGSVGVGAFSVDEDRMMLAPAVWVRNSEGEFEGPVRLPHPQLDFTGRVPQYITAVVISDDGRTVAGQIRDYSGMMSQPIVYRCDDSGNWSYELLAGDLINPSHLEFPAWPGDGPVEPMIQEYMTEEEMHEWEEAIEEWYDLGDEDAPLPEYADYISPEGRARYEDALMNYRREFLDWNSKYTRFMRVFNQCLDTGVSIEFNNVALSPDGVKYLTTGVYRIEDEVQQTPEGEVQSYYRYQEPMVFDLTDGSLTTYSTDFKLGMIATAIGEDYTVMATSDPFAYPEAYLFLKGGKKYTPLIDYITGISADDGEWMRENMTHPVDIYNPDDDNYDLEDRLVTGGGSMTPDMKNFVTSAFVFWTPLGGLYASYLIQPYLTGVEQVEACEGNMRLLSGSRVDVGGEETHLELFDIAGIKILDLTAQGEVMLPVGSGIYLLRASAADGTVSTLRIRIR